MVVWIAWTVAVACITCWVAVKLGVGVGVGVRVEVAVGDGKYLSDNESRSGWNKIKATKKRMHTLVNVTPRRAKVTKRLVGFSCSLGFELKGHLPG